MIILNYEEWYNGILKNGFGKFPNQRDMQIVCSIEKENGKSEDEIVSMLSDMCKKNVELSSFRMILKKIMKVSRETKKDLRELKKEIVFTKNEINCIKSLEIYEEQKFLYILMAICKTYSTDSLFLNSTSPVKLKEVLSLAHINLSVRKGEDMLHTLFGRGFISVLPNLKYTIRCFDYETDDIAFSVVPSSKMIESFEVYLGKGIWCKSCGCYVKKRSNNTKYCSECAKKAKVESDKKRAKNTKVENE